MEISKAHRLLYWGTCHRAGTHGHPTAIHRATTEGRGQESSGQKSRPHSPSGQNRRGHFDPALRWCAQPQHPLAHAVPRRSVRRAPGRGGAIPFGASADERRTHPPGTHPVKFLTDFIEIFDSYRARHDLLLTVANARFKPATP